MYILSGVISVNIYRGAGKSFKYCRSRTDVKCYWTPLGSILGTSFLSYVYLFFPIQYVTQLNRSLKQQIKPKPEPAESPFLAKTSLDEAKARICEWDSLHLKACLCPESQWKTLIELEPHLSNWGSIALGKETERREAVERDEAHWIIYQRFSWHNPKSNSVITEFFWSRQSYSETILLVKQTTKFITAPKEYF